jgi:hemerythrin
MAIMLWDDRYAVGVRDLDDQHRGIFDTLNRLHDAILADRGAERLTETIDFMLGYTVKHFIAEEAHMAAIGFPGLAEHKEEHAMLLWQTEEYLHAFRNEPSSAKADELARFLIEWLTHHILGTDKRYAVHRVGG